MDDLFKNFDELLDGAQLDPRPRAKAACREITEAVLRGVPLATVIAMLPKRLEVLGQRIANAVTVGNFSAVEDLLGAYDTELRSALRYEREHGSLKPITPESEVARFAPFFGKRLFNSIHVENLCLTLKPGERVLAVEWWAIRTDRRSISRDELEAIRPVTHRNHVSWASQFPSRSAIEAAEAAEFETEALR